MELVTMMMNPKMNPLMMNSQGSPALMMMMMMTPQLMSAAMGGAIPTNNFQSRYIHLKTDPVFAMGYKNVHNPNPLAP